MLQHFPHESACARSAAIYYPRNQHVMADVLVTKQMQVNCCCNQHLYLSSTSRQHILTLTLPFLSVEALKWIDSLRLSSAEVEEGVDSLAAQARPAAVLLGKRQRYS